MMVNKYTYLLKRVEYPRERGYRMEASDMPDWMHITVTNDGESKYLTVYSKIHMDKEVRLSPNYSTDFSDSDIIKDLSGEVSHRFL